VSEGLAGDFHDELFIAPAVALGVDLLAEPSEDECELPAADAIVEIGEFGDERIGDLGSEQISKGVRAEVADPPLGPVHILHAPFGVIAGLEAEEDHT